MSAVVHIPVQTAGTRVIDGVVYVGNTPAPVLSEYLRRG